MGAVRRLLRQVHDGSNAWNAVCIVEDNGVKMEATVREAYEVGGRI
jgi:hypothetical protein